MRSLLILAAVLATALVTAPAALACGGLFLPVEAQSGAAFEAQTVLIHRRADRLDLHVRMTVTPGEANFSWVLPAPVGAQLSLGDDALFDKLDALTRPSITVEYVGGNGGCSAGDSAGAGSEPGGVDVKEVGRIGEYDYAIIASGDAEAVATWLTNNGYALPQGAAAALQPYADAGLDFIGVRLTRPAAMLDEPTRPTPLVLSVEDGGTDLPVYPLGLSALSTDGLLPVLIYVLGPARAAVTGVEATSVVEIADRIRAHRWMTYEDAVDAAQAETERPLYVTDAVVLDPGAKEPALAALGGAVLTRLSARLPQALVKDAVLAWHPDAQGEVDPIQYRSVGDPDEGCAAASGGHALPWLLVLLLGFTRLRRRR
ncbi:MAG: DUF2330 domain-containing protein [Myxococcales bacterium]|nr:DUF2330 domain-containing protein [Myxococcales bacterium]